ncbi:MAG: dihydrodipicolinate synthase family protein [Patescibacteria group bacterium]|jgi:4-hydroxy-tetrahydrodipicolinate synthase|nr:dihydrodipicolinate synthase family protein [Patescibacteria group bacterium]
MEWPKLLTTALAADISCAAWLPTMFSDNGLGVVASDPATLDYQAQEALLEHLLISGVDALIVGGTIGEFQTITLKEFLGLIQRMVLRVNTRAPIVVAVETDGTLGDYQLIGKAINEGASAILAMPPKVYGDITCHYQRLLKTGFPIIIGVGDDIRQINAIQEVSGYTNLIGAVGLDVYSLMFLGSLAKECGLKVWCGNDQLLNLLETGNYVGAFSLTANVLPERLVRLAQDLTDLDRVCGQREFKKLLPLFQLIGNHSPIAVKQAVNMIMGQQCPACYRLPFTPLPPHEASHLANVLGELVQTIHEPV